MPERLYGVASVCTKRYLLHYFAKGQLPDISIFKFSEMCSRENPIPEINLKSKYLTTNENNEGSQIIAPYLVNIEKSICHKVITT